MKTLLLPSKEWEKNLENDLWFQFIVENTKEKCPKDDYDDTPLHFSARNGHLAVFKLLMEYCKHINPGNMDGNTPLHMAALNGHLKICEAILENIGKSIF